MREHPLSRLRRLPPLLRERDNASARRRSGHGVCWTVARHASVDCTGRPLGHALSAPITEI